MNRVPTHSLWTVELNTAPSERINTTFTSGAAIQAELEGARTRPSRGDGASVVEAEQPAADDGVPYAD